MRLFQDKFSIYKKADEPLYRTPGSVQECIELVRISESGIFEVSKNRYSKSYLFTDVNYNTTSEAEQVQIFESYCKFLNAMDVEFKVTVNNKNKNMKTLREKVLFSRKGDGNDRERECYNRIMEKKIVEGKQGTWQERYLTVSLIRKNYEEAKAAFANLEAVLQKAFGELGSGLTVLNGVERLRILHDFYRMGESLNSKQKSIIDRCVRLLYQEIREECMRNRGRKEGEKETRLFQQKTLRDYYDILVSQPEMEAKELALSLELFIGGSLNIFAHETNVDMDNKPPAAP